MDRQEILETVCGDIEMLSSRLIDLLGNDEATILASANLRSALHILRGNSSAARPYAPLRSLSVDPSSFAPSHHLPPGIRAVPPGSQPVHPSAFPGPNGPPPPPMSPDEMRREAALRLVRSGALPDGSAQRRMAEQILAGDDYEDATPEEGEDEEQSHRPRSRSRRRRRPSSNGQRIPVMDPNSQCPAGCGDAVGEHPVVRRMGTDDEGRSVIQLCGNRLARSFVVSGGTDAS